jgi:ribosome-associated protein YbcJ (S4-like RNA binding protein)
MRRGLENALDECLTYLGQGEALETCLQRFPAYRSELEPLLRVAQGVRATVVRPPLPPRLAQAGRARFLAEAQRRRAAQQARPERGWFAWMPRPLVWRGMVTMALIVVLMGGFLGGGSAVSANSLPGDALYGVKRASENVRLALTFDVEARASLEQQLEQTRLAEVRQVVEQRREVEVNFAGVVSDISGDTMIVDGIAVRLAQDVRKPVVGAKVQVAAKTQENGTLAAHTLAVRAEPPVAEAPQALPSPTAPFVKPASPTALPMPTETPKPTATPVATSTSPATATTLPTATALLTETATRVLDTVTPTATPLPTLTFTPTPEPTMVPPPRPVMVRVEGRIDEIRSDYWMVSTQRIHMRPGVQINQTSALARVGGWAIVNAMQEGDGRLVAQDIVVVREPDVEFGGAVESIAADKWVIAAREVTVNAETVIEGVPLVGALAQVRAEQYAGGRLVAKRISVREMVVQIDGLIQSFSATKWVVAGQEVTLDGDTRIEGTPAVGAIAEVEAVVREGGVKLARRIRVQSSTPPTAVPPTATPIPPTATRVSPTATPAPPTATPVPPTATPVPPTATATRGVQVSTITAVPPTVAPTGALPTAMPTGMSPTVTPAGGR